MGLRVAAPPPANQSGPDLAGRPLRGLASGPVIHDRRTPLLVFAAALLLRGLFALWLRGLEATQTLSLDGAYYHETAAALVRGPGWPDTPFFMAPGMPLWLSWLYRLGGVSVGLAQAGQVFWSAIAATLIFLCARRLDGRAAGLIAAGAWILYGYGQFLDVHLVGAPALSALFALTAWSWLRARQDGQPRWLLVAGFALGVASAFRGSFLVVGVIALGLEALLGRGSGRGPSVWARDTLLLVSATLLAVAPLTLHNLQRGSRALVSTNGGINYYIGNHEGAQGVYHSVEGVLFAQPGSPVDGESVAEASRRAGRVLDPDGASAWWWRQGLRFHLEHPGQSLRLQARKLLLLLGPDEIPQLENFDWAQRDSPWLRLDPVRWPALLGLALVALVLAPALLRSPLLALLLAQWITVVSFFVSARHRYPSAALLAVLAGVGAVACVRAWRTGRRRRVLRVSLSAVVVTAVLGLVQPPLDLPSVEFNRLYARATRAMEAEDYTTAVRAYRDAVAVEPGHSAAWANLGFCLQRQGRVDAAARAYARAIELDPSHPLLRRHRASLLLALGREREAEELLREQIDLHREDLGARLALAEIALRRGDEGSARRQLERILNAAPEGAIRQRARDLLDRLRPHRPEDHR